MYKLEASVSKEEKAQLMIHASTLRNDRRKSKLNPNVVEERKQ